MIGDPGVAGEARPGNVAGALPAALITALVACMLVALWFALPLARRS